jgi:hypothetical protein
VDWDLTGRDPKAAEALVEVVDAEKPPLRVLFGADVLGRVASIYEQRLRDRVGKLAQGRPTAIELSSMLGRSAATLLLSGGWGGG